MVSIIIPIYNVQDYINDCLYSVYTQTYSEIEVILVNDCTPDNSMSIAHSNIEKLKKRFNVKIIDHKSNKGLSAARNSGVKEATGEWVYFLDSDDEITPDCIECFVRLAERYLSVDFIVGGIRVIGRNISYRLTTSEYVIGNDNILKCYISGMWYEMAWNKLIRKEYFVSNNLWFKEGLLHEDQLFSYQLATTALTMATVNKPTYIYKMRMSGAITSSNGRKNFDSFICILEYMVDSVMQKYSTSSVTLEYAQIIRFSYSILLSLYGKHNLTEMEVVNYELKVDRICRIVTFYKCKLPVPIRIKLTIIKLPQTMRKVLLKWHNKKIQKK